MIRAALLGMVIGLSLRASYSQSDHFFVTISGGNLHKIHVPTCTTTFIGATGLGFGDIALTPSGELFGIISGEIHRIDTTDATTTFIGQSTAPGVSLVALNDSTLLVEFGMDLYSISTADASTSFIGQIGYSASGDLTWYDGDLFMSSGGHLVRITSEDTFNSISSVSPVSAFDPDWPSVEGLATAMVTYEYSSILGFRYPDLLCYSPIDGSYQTICQPPLPGGVPGAASAPPSGMPVYGCGTVGMANDELNDHTPLRIWTTSGQLNVSIPSGVTTKGAILRDLAGKIVRYAAMYRSGAPSIDVTSLPGGIYSLEVLSDWGIFTGRFIHIGIE